MATWPHQETKLTEHEKDAYRLLLYHGMLNIRMLCQPWGVESRNPFEWLRQYRFSRVAGAVADWMHNLAYFASKDFQGFDADWFWQEYESLTGKFEQFRQGYMDFRRIYEEQLNRANTA